MKISEIIEHLIARHPPAAADTVDVVKYGDAAKECTGVAVTCYASVPVIRECARLGVNLLIVHEPTFYNGQDDVAWLADDPIFKAKTALLDETGIVIFRDHDRIHGGPPMDYGQQHMDGIFYGLMRELGWDDYLHLYPNKPLIYHIPETTGRALAAALMEKLNLSGVRVVGDADTVVRNVFFCEHVWGDERDRKLIEITEAEDIDAIIPLEIVDWTLSEYVRDSAALGRPRVLLEMGHFNFEELGMKHMTRWLPEIVGADTPVYFLPSGDSFQYITR